MQSDIPKRPEDYISWRWKKKVFFISTVVTSLHFFLKCVFIFGLSIFELNKTSRNSKILKCHCYTTGKSYIFKGEAFEMVSSKYIPYHQFEFVDSLMEVVTIVIIFVSRQLQLSQIGHHTDEMLLSNTRYIYLFLLLWWINC